MDQCPQLGERLTRFEARLGEGGRLGAVTLALIAGSIGVMTTLFKLFHGNAQIQLVRVDGSAILPMARDALPCLTHCPQFPQGCRRRFFCFWSL
jgi:hypothetical protein